MDSNGAPLGLLIEYIENLLFDTDLDLSLCEVARDDPPRFVVSTKTGAPRIALALLFGILCLVLIGNTLLRECGR